MKKGKIIVLSAPSGSGKSTIIHELMRDESLRLKFSISATSREPRGAECDGREYYFLSKDDFAEKVKNHEFVEWEEVYQGTCYGTLVSEVKRITENEQCNLIMDIDVKGALNVKKHYGNEVLTVFIMPPSIVELEKRLRGRGTDSEDSIQKRLNKAEYEMGFSSEFDRVVINDELTKAIDDVKIALKEFL